MMFQSILTSVILNFSYSVLFLLVMPPKEKKLSKKERKLEKQRKNQEKKCILLLEYLEREVKYGNVTRRKHERSWKELVMKVGLEKIRDDLEYTWQLFEWALDIKDCEISELMDELNHVNEQYSLTLQNHNMAIQGLLYTLRDDLKRQNDEFLVSLQNIKNRYHEEELEYQKYSVEAQHIIKTLLYRMEFDNEHSCRDQMTHYFCLMESFTAAESERESVEEIYSKKMTKMWNKSQEILNQHVSKSQNYTSTAQKDKAAFDLSEFTVKRNLKKILYFIKVIKKLQTKLSFLYSTDGERLRQLVENHEEFTNYLFILKGKLFKDNSLDASRKRLLVHSAQKTLDNFRRIFRKGELLVRNLSVNRRYETSTEKVLPYPVHERPLKISTSKTEMSKGCSMTEKLFFFYQKMAAADTSRVALMEEKKVLQLEQIQIRRKFQDFCGCVNCDSQFSIPKREKGKRTFSYFEKSDFSTFFKMYHQLGENSATKEKLREMRKKILAAEEEERQRTFQENFHNLK